MTLDELLLSVMEFSEAERGLIVDAALRVLAVSGFEQDELETLHEDDDYNLLRKALLDGLQRNTPIASANVFYLPVVESMTGFKLRAMVMIPLRQGAYLLYCDTRPSSGRRPSFEEMVAFVCETEPNLVRRTM